MKRFIEENFIKWKDERGSSGWEVLRYIHLIISKNRTIFNPFRFTLLEAGWKKPAVSEFMSQKLELITLHGMVNEGGATGVSPSHAETKGEYHECDQRRKGSKSILSCS